VVALCIALASCGDDNDGRSSASVGSTATDSTVSSSPTTAVDAEADQQAAEQALLVLADFPSGWSESPQSENSNSDDEVKRKIAACAGADGESVIDVDGALARTGTFTNPSDHQVAEAAVSVATSVDVAESRVAAFADAKFASCARDVYQEWARDAVSSNDTEVGEITVAPLNVSSAGDETVAYRVTVPVESDGTHLGEVYTDVILIRAGRGLAGLFFQSELHPFPVEDTENYIALAAERLAQVS
jgi:hypothetical protein